MINKIIYKLIIILFLLIIIDAIYLFLMNKQFSKMIIKIQKKPIRMKWNLYFLFYLIYSVIFYYFIIREKKSISYAFLLGFSFIIIYELTNYIIFKNWSIWIVILDSLWGGCLFAIVLFIYNYLSKIFSLK